MRPADAWCLAGVLIPIVARHGVTLCGAILVYVLVLIIGMRRSRLLCAYLVDEMGQDGSEWSR